MRARVRVRVCKERSWLWIEEEEKNWVVELESRTIVRLCGDKAQRITDNQIYYRVQSHAVGANQLYFSLEKVDKNR